MVLHNPIFLSLSPCWLCLREGPGQDGAWGQPSVDTSNALLHIKRVQTHQGINSSIQIYVLTCFGFMLAFLVVLYQNTVNHQTAWQGEWCL